MPGRCPWDNTTLTDVHIDGLPIPANYCSACENTFILNSGGHLNLVSRISGISSAGGILTAQKFNKGSVVLFAGSNAPSWAKENADVVLEGSADQLDINTKLSALATEGSTEGITFRFIGTIQLSGRIDFGGFDNSVIDLSGAILINQYGAEESLSQDVGSSDTVIYVDNASNFQVDMDVYLSDFDHWATENDYVRRVTAVDDNSITIASSIGTTLQVSSTGKVSNGFNYIYFSSATTDVTIIGGIFDGNSSNYRPIIGHPVNAMLHTGNVTNYIVRDVTFKNSATDGLEAVGTGSVINCKFIDFVRVPEKTYAGGWDTDAGGNDDALRVSNSRGTRVIGNEFIRVHSRMAAYEGLSAIGTMIEGNTFIDTPRAIRIESSSGSSPETFVQGNYYYVANSVTNGSFIVVPAGAMSITDNVIVGANKGIHIDPAGAATISGTVVANNKLSEIRYFGIEVGHQSDATKAANISISGNTIIARSSPAANSRGILAYTANNLVITSNNVSGFAEDIRLWSTSNYIVTSNSVSNMVKIDGLSTAGVASLPVENRLDGLLASSTTVIRAAQDLSGSIPITFTIDAQPDHPRTLSWDFVAHSNITAYTMEISGFDQNGRDRIITWTQTTGWSGATSVAFSYINYIKMTARTGTGVGDTMNVGVTKIVGLRGNISDSSDVYAIKKNGSFQAIVSGDVNTTYDTYDLTTIGIVSGDDFIIGVRGNLNIGKLATGS